MNRLCIRSNTFSMRVQKNSLCFLFLFFLIFFGSNSFAQSTVMNVKKIDKSTLNKLITERNNKPLLINVWATWCVPCREEFPDLVKLAGSYKDKMDFVGISVDEIDEIDSKIIPFMKSFNVNFDIYVIDFDDVQDFINYFDEDWNGAIPATFIYDSKKKRVSTIIGKENYEFFESEIKKVL